MDLRASLRPEVFAIVTVCYHPGALLAFLAFAAAAHGLAETQIRATLDLRAWENLGRSYVIGRNINRAYLEVESDSFDE